MRKSGGSHAVVSVTLAEVEEASRSLGPSCASGGPSAQIAVQQAADAKLAAALRRGEAGSASAFYDRVEHVVTGALVQVLGPGDRDHEDLAQLSLERIVSSVVRGRYAGRCNLATWASLVTTRTAIDALRRRRHERRIFARGDEDAEPSVPAPEQGRPDRKVDSGRKLASLRTALGKISPDKAEALVLFEVMGHDLSQIAEMTGVSLAAAQSRLVRGRKELRAVLEKELGEFDVG